MTRLQNMATRLLGIELPVIQAPMAGVSTPALACAVTGAGALGSIAIGAMNPEAADRIIGETLRQATGPINVNLFVHEAPHRDPDREAEWIETLRPSFQRFSASPPAGLREIYRSFNQDDSQLAVLLAHRPPVVSFHFGVPAADRVDALKAYGAVLVATATCAAEAQRLTAAGIDLIIAQGFEAGGHRGVFDPAADSQMTTLKLLAELQAVVQLPVMVAGGLKTGRDIANAMALGAAGAQLGSAFVGCPESAASPAHRQALSDSRMRTAMTRAISGRPARGIINGLIRELDRYSASAPDYPLPYDAAKQLADAAAAAGVDDLAAWWASGVVPEDRQLPAGALVALLKAELLGEMKARFQPRGATRQ
jgi:nitronate monooxygenase